MTFVKFPAEVTLVGKDGVPVKTINWIGGFCILENHIANGRHETWEYVPWRPQDGPPYVAYLEQIELGPTVEEANARCLAETIKWLWRDPEGGES